MSFRGFSEDDIRKLTKPQDVSKSQKGSNKTSLKKVTFKANHSVNHASKPKILHSNHVNHISAPAQEVPENAKLSVPEKSANEDTSVEKTPQSDQQDAPEKLEKPTSESTFEENNEPAKEDKKFKDLTEFEARQKLIEQQNRKRKELLAKALADRTKRTQAEAQKLNEIKEEFKKLDAMLSGDVKILRKQIELASIEYTECQKRYHRIEKEFLEAKLLMHQKQEKKEMLTEHLCTIIEKNEERKAEKLNELLQRLQLAPPEIDVVTDNNVQENVDTAK